MLQRILALAQKEFIQIRRDKRNLVMMLGIPVLWLLLFGYAFSFDVNEVSVAVVDQSGTETGARVAKAFGDYERFRAVDLSEASEQGIYDAIHRDQVKMAIFLPPGFGAGRVEPESRGRVGYLTGRFSLYPDLTVWENLAFFGRVYAMSRSELEQEGLRLLQWVGLLPFRDRLAGQLSGGMRQKLALACAVVHRPPTLILDEPTTAVDPIARADLWQLLRQQPPSF